METSEQLLSERRERILLLTINNPDTRNALGPEIYFAGAEAIRAAGSDPGIGAIVLAGAGRHFCSGGDLNRLRANRQKSPAVVYEGVGRLHDFILTIRNCPKPVIAAIEGSAAGAGFSLALACDLFVAATNAVFTMAYVKIGLSPDGGATAFLARALPSQTVAEILLEGGKIEAARLHQLGVVNRLCDEGEALFQALAWANKLAAGPVSAMGRIKRLVGAAYHNDIPSQLELERQYFVESLLHDECGEGIDAFFAKRSPDFTIGGFR